MSTEHPAARERYYRWPLRIGQALCFAGLILLAVPLLPLALALEWIEERLYGKAKTCAVLHD